MVDSIREALSKAMADDEQDESKVEGAVVEQPKPEQESIADPEAPVIGASPDKPEAAKPEVATAPPKEDKSSLPSAEAKPTEAPTAPASWRPAEKAAWDKVPAEARAAVMRREQETQRVLSSSADARRLQQNFQNAVKPFEPLFEAYGVKDPLTAIVPLMQTRAALEIGTVEQKAQLVANLVHQFGVDITKLDEALASGPRQQAPAPQPAFDPKSIPELAPLFQIAEQYKQATAAKVDAALAEVEALPHFEELREDMADVLDKASQRGKNLSVKQAYDIVASTMGLAPSPASKQATSVSEAAAIMAKSRKAASSVAGAPKGAAGTKPTSLRDSIVAAMEG